jgi:hypothetical protein
MQPKPENPLKQFIIKHHKMLFVFTACAVLVLILILSASLKNTPGGARFVQPTGVPTQPAGKNGRPTTKQEPFTVTSTTPSNGQADVIPGEIQISFTTNVPIVSENSFAVSIGPALPNYGKYINSYPTKTITSQVYGAMAPGTKYTVAVYDASKKLVYSWSFTTSQTPAQSSSGLVREEEQQIIKNSYPLFNYVPYNSNDFYIDYTGKLTLLVTVKINNMEQVKKEALGWIKSKGVDPSTHVIHFEYP